MSIKIVLALGNPGTEYEKTRHNVGFRVADACVRAFDLQPAGVKFKSLFYEGRLGSVSLKVLKPQTYMNLSGQAAIQALQFYKCELSDVWVIYDDFDIPFGALRLRPGGSPGTHNGAKSVTQLLGSQAFPKLRVGIGPKPGGIAVDRFVLSAFGAQEERDMPFIVDHAVSMIRVGCEQGLMRAMELNSTDILKGD
jgi:PTH1 family peptidyl-tRNA hydrolase